MLEIVNQEKDARPFVVLAHNPDTISKYDLLDSETLPDLTVVGHTHCGQIRLPVIYPMIYRSILPTEGDFDCGLTRHKINGVDTQLFITPGL
jgi:predicted MPP superfamily phosphohydrolase